MLTIACRKWIPISIQLDSTQVRLISPSRNFLEANLHYLLFCALGGLGAAYALTVHEAAHAHEHGAEGHTEHSRMHRLLNAHSSEPGGAIDTSSTHGASNEASSTHGASHEEAAAAAVCASATFVNLLLAISAGLFLLASALMILNSSDPTAGHLPRLPQTARFLLRFMAALLAFSLPWLGCLVSFLVDSADDVITYAVPAVMILAALVEVWGSQPKHGAPKLW